MVSYWVHGDLSKSFVKVANTGEHNIALFCVMIPLMSDATLMEKLFTVTLQWMVTMMKVNVTMGLWRGYFRCIWDDCLRP